MILQSKYIKCEIKKQQFSIISDSNAYKIHLGYLPLFCF